MGLTVALFFLSSPIDLFCEVAKLKKITGAYLFALLLSLLTLVEFVLKSHPQKKRGDSVYLIWSKSFSSQISLIVHLPYGSTTSA
jgi:hypothetical protein